VIEVLDAAERSRYEILVDGAFAGFTHYQHCEGALVFDHTVIKEDFAGQGLASKLVRATLDDVRGRQRRIVPLCEYVAGWLVKNPDYGDLVDRELLAHMTATA
jgi:predicted GNAT family acetyltransferase